MESLWKGAGVRGAKKDFSGLGKQARKSAAGMKAAGVAAGVMGGLVATLSNKVLQATGAVKDLAIESILLGARYNTLEVVVDNLGQRVGFTAREMRGLEKDLESTGISMVGSREAIAKLIQANIDLSHATDLARVAQDGAVIAGTNSTDAYGRLISFISTGNVRVARQIGLFIDLQSGYKRWAAANNRAAESLTEVEKAQIRATLAVEAGSTIAGTYEKAMNTAGKQLGSLTRDLDNLKTAVGLNAQGMLEKAVPAVREWAQGLSGTLLAQVALTEAVEKGNLTQEEAGVALLQMRRGALSSAEAMDIAKEAMEGYYARLDNANAVMDPWIQTQISAREAAEGVAGALTGVSTTLQGGTAALRDYTREALGAALVNSMLEQAMADLNISQQEAAQISGVAERFDVDLGDDFTETVSNFNTLASQGIDPATASMDELSQVSLGVTGLLDKLTANEHRIVLNIEVRGDDIPDIPGVSSRGAGGGGAPGVGGTGFAGLQHGGTMVVPPGFPRDTFRLGVSSGEQVSGVPAEGGDRIGMQGDVNVTFQGGAQDEMEFLDTLKRITRRS